jgi:nitrate reductase molybdenum cofactor assembly chaperone NarJ/NarW
VKRSAAATAFGCASVLLSYPDESSFTEDLATVGRAIEELPVGHARAGLDSTAGWLVTMTPLEAAAIYVDTFDLRRGTTLYLTYYRHGDTRERGMALAALADTYRAAGFAVAAGELPDHLPALLELASVHSAGAAVLAEHRMALDALRLALEKSNSPYATAVDAVSAALPGPTRTDRAALRRYREQGPPSERVGLEPFAPPETLGQRVTLR